MGSYPCSSHPRGDALYGLVAPARFDLAIQPQRRRNDPRETIGLPSGHTCQAITFLSTRERLRSGMASSKTIGLLSRSRLSRSLIPIYPAEGLTAYEDFGHVRSKSGCSARLFSSCSAVCGGHHDLPAPYHFGHPGWNFSNDFLSGLFVVVLRRPAARKRQITGTGDGGDPDGMVVAFGMSSTGAGDPSS